MRVLLAFFFLLFFTASWGQYYYKDIIGSKESSRLIKSYRDSKVKRVLLTSYDADNVRSEHFFVEQQYAAAIYKLTTATRSDMGSESFLISSADINGNVVRTVDSNNFVVSITNYGYNAAGQLISVSSSSTDSAKTSTESEDHLWQWKGNTPLRMLRIKNKIDTSFIDFKLDEKGNVSEEQETRKKIRSEQVYYYYNDNNLLTDIVRYNYKAKRMIPDYLFEYSDNGLVIQMITVPANSFDYLIWRYQYNAQGLKTKEKIYKKDDKRNAIGTIEYQYFF